METSILPPTQKYAASALYALALHQSQIHQTKSSTSVVPLDEEPVGDGMSVGGSTSVSEESQLWINENSGLLCPVFRFLDVDNQAWHGLKETAKSSSQVRHHIGAFLTLLLEEKDGTSSDIKDKELALTKTVDAMVLSMENSPVSSEDVTEIHENERKCGDVYSNAEKESISDATVVPCETSPIASHKISSEKGDSSGSGSRMCEKPMEEGALLSYPRKVTVLYELLSAFVADTAEDDKKCSQLRKGYDARHRVALRLLATWLGIKWKYMEAMEIMVACSLMDSVKEDVKDEESISPESRWAKWKHAGIIGAAAMTGGTLMAITGGLAAPAIAEGVSALAPALGSIVPAIGASGFAAAASATGSVAGSVSVAASFGAAGAGLSGSKMARRIGEIDEFEFKEVGGNHNQGRLAVGILISGLVFKEDDFLQPWEGHDDNLERYALQWESKNLIAVSTAIQDWLTSKIAMELMRGGAMMTVLSSLVAALALPVALVTASDFIDSKWAIAVDRSDKAGKLLAEVLLKGLQGNRPVTLIGFSLGARVIFKCLEYLAERGGDCEAGLVERVVLLGAPVSIKDEKWENARKIVAGRFVNAYSTNDWTLGIAFRASLLSQGLAGIQPVEVPGVENVDVTQLIESHSSYIGTTKLILEQLELDSYYPVFRTTQMKSQEERISPT